MRVNNPCAGVAAYVKACCYKPSPDRLGELLDDNVTLQHETNGEAKPIVKGKNEVLSIYKKYLFDITSEIKVKNITYSAINEFTASMTLYVDENKKDFRGISGTSRWEFIDNSTFTFVKKDDGSLKIIAIFTKAMATKI